MATSMQADNTSAMISEMPMSLKRRFVGLAAIAGVIFLINFPSPTAVAAVVAVLIAGVIFTSSASTSLDTGGDVKARLDEFRRQKLQKALDISRANAAAHREASVNAPTAPASEKAPPTSIAQAERQAAPARDSSSLNHEADSSGGTEEGTMGNNTTAPKSETSVGVQQKLEQPIQHSTPLLEQQEDRRQVPAQKPSPGSTNPSSDHSTANGHLNREQLPPNNASGPNKPALAGGAAVLARLRQQRAQAQAKSAKTAEQEVIFAYASQTGTAQEIAKGLQAESASKSIKSKVLSLNELGFENLVKMQAAVLVLIASSTGDGDSPDNAAKFYATLRRRTQEPGQLKNVKFTSLGLGDSNYTRFMGVSRALRSRMQELGAQLFYDHAEADEVDGLENTIDPWTDNLWPALKKVLMSGGNESGQAKDGAPPDIKSLEGVPALPACRVEVRWIENATDTAGEDQDRGAVATPVQDPEGLYSPEQPYWAEVSAARYLTAPSSDRKVLHIEVNLKGSGISYLPGDSLGVMPENDEALVNGIIKRLGLEGISKFHVRAKDGSQAGLLPHLGCPCTVHHAFQAGVDLTSAPSGREEYKALITPFAPSLLDLLLKFPSCKPPLAELLDALPQLMPRLYSISSSPLCSRDTAHVAFSIVKLGSPAPTATAGVQNGNGAHVHQDGPRGRWGVATGWLEKLMEPLLLGQTNKTIKIPVHLKRGGSFGHPADLSHPMLMIGPGTGVAPFRGFLQHRRQLLKEHGGKAGQAVLYFGCRQRSEDYLYGDELEEFARSGTLDAFEVAFSRASKEKVYVQHRMLEQASSVIKLLKDPHVHIFVCGDGAHMAKDVHQTLLKILETEGGMTSEAATSKLTELTKAGQYIRDIWS